MNERYDILVAGGGAAGLTAAAYCARAGLKTLLCEKSEKTGGLVNTFRYRGFAFDAGIRAFEDSGIIFPMLRSLNIDLPMTQNPVSIGVVDRWTKLIGRESLQAYATLLKSFFPDQQAQIDRIMLEIQRVMGYMDVLYGIENPLFLDNFKDMEYLTKTLLPWLLKYSVNIKKASRLDEPIKTYLGKFTSSKPLIDMICQHFFAETPSFFALSYFGLYLDYRYPLGGTGQLAEKLTARLLELGGTARVNTAVVRVFPQQKQAELSDGTRVDYETLIWAANQRSLYEALREPLPQKAEEQKRLVESSQGMDSVLTLFLGVDGAPEAVASLCGAHAFYTPEMTGLSTLPHWRTLACEGEEAVRGWLTSYLERTTFEISVPALRDPSLAPAGKTGLVVSTLFDYSLSEWYFDTGEYEAFKSLCTSTILRILEQNVFPSLAQRVEFSLCATPLTIERETGNFQGAITGWAFTNVPSPAIGDFPKIAHSVETPIPDVLQCGHWTFSPAGLPVAILTGKLAADAAVKQRKRRRKPM
ncbi:MAG: NAD(P)/FAD-dependent oxidoreductase [Clostridiaceae bacterium]